MVKILTNLFNKRKREIERLNDIIVKRIKRKSITLIRKAT